MGSDKNRIQESKGYGRECDEEYYMKECYHQDYDCKCDDKEYDRDCYDYDKKYDHKEYDKKCDDHDYDKKCEHDYDDRKCEHHDYDKKHDVKVIQTKVIKGTGCKDFFLEADFDFPQGTPLYLIESIDTWVDVYDTKVICEDKVIFNAWVYKNIIYKVVSGSPVQDDGVTVTGGVDHITKAIPLAGCINIDTKKCGKLDPCRDFAEVIKAKVIGHVEDKLEKVEIKQGNGESFNPPVFVYGSLHEKMCVRIDLKVVRWEHVSVEIEDKC
ncbi:MULTISPECIES: hypothetical protein [Clostridium]|uniref:SipL SPOCS domain-containing protein n=1 Tax=Clostridium disporicum TaxID=84024 RepID=A0A174D5F9_9CLOT|nr:MULTISPECIES: hypothetical protein [Clostridium]MCD2500668.1 hypothetical protein [Clostridium sp. NSJ-145]CUO19305.1 Uncharacterised protein [Clostridium disporicum]